MEIRDQEGQLTKVIIPYRITRSFVKANPSWIFLYSNDYYERGCLGQAWNLANERNTFRIPTVIKYCANPKFFQDFIFLECKSMVDEALSKVPRDGRIIVPLPKIGRGCARLPELAPKVLAYIEEQIKLIKFPHIETDYHGIKYPTT